MVKGGSRMSDSGGQESTTAKTLAATKDKMKVQQRMIDLTARELASTMIAMSSDQDDRAVFDENLQLIENKLMKLFARQLMHKHQYLHCLSEDLDDIEKTLDSMISFDVFLNIANPCQKTVKALMSEKLSVDTLFLMSQSSLVQLFSKHDITFSDSQKLMGLLDLLAHYYEKWERGEKPIIHDIRQESSSSRLNSFNSLASLDGRKDSYSSHTVSPPGNQQYSRSSTPITPVTPSSTQSPMPGLLHQNSTPVFPITDCSPSFKRSNSSTNTSYQAVIQDQLSSSSSSLNSDVPHSYINQVDHSPFPPQMAPAPPPPHSFVPTFFMSNAPRKNRKRGHTRSHSNPPLANIIMPEVVPENSIPNYRSPSPLSPVPPTRAGSHPSIVQNMVTSSPSAKTHPQMRRLIGHNSKNAFNRSQSTDLGGGEDSLQPLPEPPMRSNSEASSVKGSSPRQRKLSKETGTSTSMVDLPLIRCSADQLDQSEYTFPRGGKSYSVPRLANLAVNGDNGTNINNPPNVPTSPRLLTNYNPTGVIGHKIDHRFDKHVFFGVHECDYCKKTLVMSGAKCRYCKYKCHKGCSKLAPPTCGLPQDFLDYARNNKHLLYNPHDGQTHAVKQRNFSSSGEYQTVPTSPKIDDDTFLIPDLSREPTNSQYSPVIQRNRPLTRGHLSTSRLEVPHKYQPSPLHTNHSHTHSTSSSPSTSTQSSPCNTPISPHSPMDSLPMDYPFYTSGNTSVSSVPVILTDEDSMEEEIDDDLVVGHPLGRLNSEDDYGSYRYSRNSSINDISDQSRLGGGASRGLRPPPQVVLAQSLPNLLMADQADGLPNADELSSGDMVANSENNLESWVRKESLINTLSTADSKTSTLVESTLEEDDSSLGGSDFFSSQGELDLRFRIGHRNSTVDEWIIPYEDLKNLEKIGSGPVANVYKGYWHGEVAIKRFYMPDATRDQVIRFREEIAVLKKTRHENLALFMGACVTTPNFAIITSYCKGYTLYKLIHHWSEVFSLEKLVNVGKQIALAMGYLHARGIIHKGLNTKNIFIEKTTDNRDKVVITDMGLSALSSCIWSSDPDSVLIFPRTQLYYLAPEIMRCISSYHDPEIFGDLFPFTEHSDVYCYGTILYEMLIRKFPFTSDALGFAYEYETVIFMVGNGRRQEFKMTDIPKNLKELVWDCWNPTPELRPSFIDLKESLARLCRKHTPIIRSPSHPINLSKSVDNLLFI